MKKWPVAVLVFCMLWPEIALSRSIVKLRAGMDSEIFDVPFATDLGLRHLYDDVYVSELSAQELSWNPAVEWAEEDSQVHALGWKAKESVPWNVTKVGAPSAWKQGECGRGVVVAVIDTGVDFTHPAIEGKGVPGWDFISDKPEVIDDHGHGTHVSGTIAGESIGVAPCVKIMPLKFLDSSGSGSVSNAVLAVKYAVKKGARVLSNSWGGGGRSQALEDAISEAEAKGILFIAAAGNDASNNDETPTYPASYPIKNVVAVAATDSADRIASFSNYGKKTVLLAAPGAEIRSSVPGGTYESWSGTSMATPHVSGAAAIFLSSGKDWRAAKEAISECEKIRGLAVHCGGRLDLGKSFGSAR